MTGAQQIKCEIKRGRKETLKECTPFYSDPHPYLSFVWLLCHFTCIILWESDNYLLEILQKEKRKRPVRITIHQFYTSNPYYISTLNGIKHISVTFWIKVWYLKCVYPAVVRQEPAKMFLSVCGRAARNNINSYITWDRGMFFSVCSSLRSIYDLNCSTVCPCFAYCASYCTLSNRHSLFFHPKNTLQLERFTFEFTFYCLSAVFFS